MRGRSHSLFRAGFTALAIFTAGSLAALAGCNGNGGSADSDWPDKPGPKVLVSFPPLYSFVANVAGDNVNLQCLLTTHGPHTYETSARDSRVVAGADVFFINGLGLDDPIANKLKQSAKPELRMVSLAEALDENALLDPVEGAHDHGHAHDGHDHEGHDHDHHGHDHAGHDHDPHVWLGIPQAKLMVSDIAAKLGEIDPDHEEQYTENSVEYIAALDRLHAEGKELLADIPAEKRKIITFHESLGYFADSFDIEIAGVIQASAGVEPSRNRLREIVETCKEKNVRLIAVEPQYSTNAAQTVLDELKNAGIEDAALVEIDPIETAEPGELSADLYVEKMRQNLRNLSEALR